MDEEIKIFYRFLKEKKIFDIVLIECQNSIHDNYCGLIKLNSSNNKFCFVENLFSWHESKNGSSFWLHINDLWNRTLKNNEF